MEVLALTHGADVGPGLLADVAERAGHRLVKWESASSGRPPGGADAVVVFGGHQNIGEEAEHPWLLDEYGALRGWVDAGTPLLGVCLGAQALAHALGGSVTRLEAPLAGFYETELTEAGVADPVLGSLPRRLETFNGNAFGVSPPVGATVLAVGPGSLVNAFRVDGCAWGVLFHPEVTSRVPWFDDDPRRAEILAELDAKLPAWRAFGSRLLEAFLGAAAAR
jgi:GMP synthase-like glutamine amidotransferase